MGELESMNYLSGLPETKVFGEEARDALAMEKLDFYMKLAEGCMEGVQKMSLRKFNNEQCGYLADKLKVVVKSARSYLEVLRGDHQPCSSVDIVRLHKIFKLLQVLAKQIDSFIQGCCKDVWIQDAMTSTNVLEYVSSLGFNLELCRVAFCKQCSATGGLTSVEIDDMHKAEVEIVETKASVDEDTLYQKLLLEMPSFSSENKDLASYLLQRLKRVKSISASVLSGSSSGSGNDDRLGFFGTLLKWVKPTGSLGSGTSAIVTKAMWLGTPIAKKTFYGPDNPDFLKEVDILSRLCHPNIMSMFCFAKNERSCSIIMELMDEDLHKLMQRRLDENSHCSPFPILEAVDVMLQIGEGVNYLHNEGIVHRDLKSMNILIKSAKATESEAGYVHAKVADFGLSKTKERTTTYSNQTYNMGTNRWMPPEIINLFTDNQRSPSRSEELPKHPFKCDTYSFGMLCYEILTGDVPFSTIYSPNEVKKKVMEGERPNLPKDCPPKLKALIEKCWNQEPKERPTFAIICLELKYLKYLLMRGTICGDDLRACEKQSLPCEIDDLTAPTTLSLDGCSSLQQLRTEIGDLTALKTLSLNNCTRLQQLPSEIGNLTALTTLSLDGCSSLQHLRSEIGNLTTLTTFSLDCCISLKQLPNAIGNLTALATLSLDGCSSLKKLPAQIGNLKDLTTLKLDGCFSLTHLPRKIGNLSILTTFSLNDCRSLEQLPHEIGNLMALKTLSLDGCLRLEQLPREIGNLKTLTSFSLDGCSRLELLPREIGNMRCLTTLSLSGGSRLEQLPHEIGKLTALQTLSLDRCSSLKQLPNDIGHLTALTTLSLDDGSSLTHLPRKIGYLISLTLLNLDGCSNLTHLPRKIGNLSALTTMRLNGCSSLKQLPSEIGDLMALTTLSLIDCSTLDHLPSEIGNLMTLTTLHLDGCSNLEQLPHEIGNLTSLTSWSLKDCSRLRKLPSHIQNLLALTTLNLDGCSSLKKLRSEIGDLTALTTLNLDLCSKLEQLPQEIGNLTSLTTLSLNECRSLKQLPREIGDLMALTTLNLNACSKLKQLPREIGKLTALRTLSMSRCFNLKFGKKHEIFKLMDLMILGWS